MVSRWCAAVLIVLAQLVLFTNARAAELVMLEEAGCPWCARWNEEIGVIYDKTDEGKRAPLRRVDIHAPMPDAYDFVTKGGFAPTFILVDNGKEIGRIRGYPGSEFFFPLLGELLAKLEKPPSGT